MKTCEKCKENTPIGHIEITFFNDGGGPIGFELCGKCLNDIRKTLKTALERS